MTTYPSTEGKSISFKKLYPSFSMNVFQKSMIEDDGKKHSPTDCSSRKLLDFLANSKAKELLSPMGS